MKKKTICSLAEYEKNLKIATSGSCGIISSALWIGMSSGLLHQQYLSSFLEFGIIGAVLGAEVGYLLADIYIEKKKIEIKKSLKLKTKKDELDKTL